MLCKRKGAERTNTKNRTLSNSFNVPLGHFCQRIFMKLAIFVQHQKVVCYSCDAAGIWTHHRIKGEASAEIKPGKAVAVLRQVLEDQSDRIHQEHALCDVEVYLLFGVADVSAMTDAPKTLVDLHCTTWQILRLEPLLERASMTRGIPPETPLEDHKWLKTVLLPILTNTFAYSNKSFQVEEERARQEHEDTMESLRADVQTKHQEAARLQAHINALRLPDVEHLLVFLPAIYRNFWGVVRPDELALLAGTLKVPDIDSPYSEPSPDTVLMLKRRFLQLPELDRERVLGFCHELPHRLDVRPEMRDLIREI
jgi:hypothetical protein